MAAETIIRTPEQQWTSLDPPPPGWDAPMPGDKQWWMTILFVWSGLLLVVTFSWFFVGKQNVPTLKREVTPASIQQEVEAFVAKYETEPGSGIVEVPPGEDAYLVGEMWNFSSVLKLKAGHEYTIWYSSVDVVHNPIIAEQRYTFTAIPGYAYGIRITPTTPGEYLVYCSEYCGLGHQDMATKIIVEP